MRGLFIVIEGIDGCGKTTQARLLANYLGKQGCDIVLTREPGGTTAGRTFRRLLLGSHPLDPLSEILLYAADRREHVRRVIAPALRAGRVVISERFALSTVAYQGCGRGLDAALIRRLNRLVCGEVAPDATIILDINPEDAHSRRARRRPDRLESERLAFHRRVARGYRALARATPRAHLVPAAAPRKQVHERIARIIHPLLKRHGGAA